MDKCSASWYWRASCSYRWIGTVQRLDHSSLGGLRRRWYGVLEGTYRSNSHGFHGYWLKPGLCYSYTWDSTSFAQPVPPSPRDIHLPRSTPNQILQEPTEYDLGCDIIAVETSEQLELSAIANKGSQRCTFPKLQSLAFVNCLLSLGGLLNIAAMHKTTIKGLELHRVIFDPGHYIDGVADIANICKQHLPNLAYLCLARLLTYSKDYTNPHWDHTGKVEALEYHEWRMGDREIRTKGARLGLKWSTGDAVILRMIRLTRVGSKSRVLSLVVLICLQIHDNIVVPKSFAAWRSARAVLHTKAQSKALTYKERISALLYISVRRYMRAWKISLACYPDPIIRVLSTSSSLSLPSFLVNRIIVPHTHST